MKNKCKICGKEFITYLCRMKNNSGTTCSRKCGGLLRRGKPINIGKNNGMWKTKNITLGALHQWLRSRKPKPKLCEECNKTEPYDLANISGEYKRDVNDFEWLCRRCHMFKDGRLKIFNTKYKGYKGKIKPRKQITCFICGKKIKVIITSKQKFCSKKCFDIFQRKNPVIIICKKCSKKIKHYAKNLCKSCYMKLKNREYYFKKQPKTE